MSAGRGTSLRRRRLRWTWTFLVVAIAAGGWVTYRVYSGRTEPHGRGGPIPGITEKLAGVLPERAPEVRFTDVTDQAGLRFVSFAGARSSQLPEDMGAGMAWGDFDNDGDDDLFLVSAGGSLDEPQDSRAPSVLMENLGDGTFRPVESFPELRIVGMAAAWGDVDADGWLDLVVSGYRSLVLLRNREGRLVRDEAFPAPDGYWAGVSWGDYDQDRDLDLYVCGYVRYEEEPGDMRESMQYGKSVPYTLNPSSYSPERNLLLRNDGRGGFVDVAEELGVANPEGRSLGALWHDVNADGRLDLYVANDISDNVLYLNRGGTFEDVSHAAWVADYRGAMGLAAGDWNGDGDDDLFVTHWVAQENALYDSLLADSAGAPQAAGVRFMDVADERGLGQSALPTVGWGTEFGDLDADGWLDLVVSNGSTFETEDEPPRLQPQRLFLLWNDAGDGFHDLATASEPLSRPYVGRGLALADYDGDGDLDVVQFLHGEGVRLLRNDMDGGNSIRIRLRSRAAGGRPTGRGEGTTLELRAGGRTLRRTVGGVSYLSQSSSVVHAGLGEAVQVDELIVYWHAGEHTRYGPLAAGGLWEVVEGEREPRLLDESGAAAGSARAAAGNREAQVAFWRAQRDAVHAMKVDRDLPRAVEGFRQALALDPRHEDSLYYLGQCLATLGDEQGALESLRRLTEVNPSSHRGWRGWAELRAATAGNAGELAEAAAALERALQVNLEETGALLTLAEVEILQGDLASARQRLEWACRSNPRAVGGFFLLGYLGWVEGDGEQARRRLTEVIEARGPEWKPAGTVAEGDVAAVMHREGGLLARFWERWDGSPDDPAAAFTALDSHVIARRRELAGG